ncbi:shufflon system plasmid conjugative transfer pilus tip adhesin PilV [Dickeya chrysanthemi]|uniref:shufflon system plasmid conjugative transfer pilus tip adhesin PilV n=1 Tax=Dickeya chrysanthemi TaxID=556 RepID=UPI000586A5CD|nr:shufflon system plasmid conjugative transfer pilus tip adhesin PilV [Dickeya chrysanthemi]MBX9446341.1 shufflon system plasmid conjugative transfer pilus tip adhesin PilV [Dickeya chrysanthemi]
MNKQNKKGFSLLELILVLGVGTTVTFMKFQDMKNEQETVVAKAVGEQIKQMGEAVNGYINIRYDKLSTLTSSSSQSSDPGPRTCSGSVCEITYQTLVNEGLLPSSFSGVNAQKSSYKIFLRRSGNVPNYIINGLITTTNVWADGGKVRYDLLGKAMQAAGIDSGMTKTDIAASGYGGQWSELSTDYSNITAAGLLAYRVGYDSAMYSVYLRRDGTLPMTGDLNMGGQNIYNAQNITAAGITTSGAIKSLGDIEVGNDLTINGMTYANVIQAKGDISSKNAIYTTDSTGTVKTYMNANGDIYSSGNINSNGTVNAAYVWASGNLNSNYVHSNGNIDANGRINAGEFVYVNGQANVGWGCSPNGLIGRDGSGKILSCVNGVWSSMGGTSKNIALYQCSYNICDNNSASTCSGQISTMSYCQCRQGGAAISCPYIGKLIAD